MSGSFNVNIASVDCGAMTGAGPFPAFYVPPGFGGITLLDVEVVGDGAGTAVGLAAIQLTDVGTPVADGTIGSFDGTVTYAAGVKADCTISTAYVEAGKWIGLEQTSGTAPSNTKLVLSYLQGK
jgi:hypothetical protein